MKLRLRSLETKETLKIEAPVPCSLRKLKEIVSDRASPSSSSSLDSVHLSLNRSDELVDSNSEHTLESLGIIPGDLIFFTINPNGFTSQNVISQFRSGGSSNQPRETLIVESDFGCESRQDQASTPQFSCSSSNNTCETLIVEPNKGNELLPNQTKCPISESGIIETLELESRKEGVFSSENGTTDQIMVEETPSTEEIVNMDIDVDDDDDNLGKGFSVPGFLRKVFNEKLGDSNGCDHKLVVIAVLAVFSESGFVGLDTESKSLHLPDKWPSLGFTMSLYYTLPEIVQRVLRTTDESLNCVETIVLKIQSLGKYVNFYGSLAGKGSGTYRLCLNKELLAFALNLMWANFGFLVEANRGGLGISDLNPEKEVFKFWRTVKDELALPLLIDLCEAANLPPPSCFGCLPTDIKLRVLELLPGDDLAKMECVSPELRFLAGYDGLWKQKFVEHFGDAEVAEASADVAGYWKNKFVKTWVARKRRRVVMQRRRLGLGRRMRGPFPHRPLWIIGGESDMVPGWGIGGPFGRDPYSFRAPSILGGDHDIGPQGLDRRAAGRRGVRLNCNLGGRCA